MLKERIGFRPSTLNIEDVHKLGNENEIAAFPVSKKKKPILLAVYKAMQAIRRDVYKRLISQNSGPFAPFMLLPFQREEYIYYLRDRFPNNAVGFDIDDYTLLDRYIQHLSLKEIDSLLLPEEKKVVNNLRKQLQGLEIWIEKKRHFFSANSRKNDDILKKISELSEEDQFWFSMPQAFLTALDSKGFIKKYTVYTRLYDAVNLNFFYARMVSNCLQSLDPNDPKRNSILDSARLFFCCFFRDMTLAMMSYNKTGYSYVDVKTEQFLYDGETGRLKLCDLDSGEKIGKEKKMKNQA